MDFSQSKNSKSKSKNWNKFRSPQQKDLFDFLDHDDFSHQKHNNRQKQSTNQKKHKISMSKSKVQTSKNDQIAQQNQDISQRSNLTFATRYQQEQSKTKTQRTVPNPEQFFRASHKKSRLGHDYQNDDKGFLTSRFNEKYDSLQNLFLKQITRTEQRQLEVQSSKKKLFQNFHIQTSQNQNNNIYIDQQLILKTLNDIKQINQQNLFVNKKILSAMLQQRQSECRNFKRKKTTSNQVKSSQKKQSIQRNACGLQGSSKGFSQSKHQFYLYQKPMRTISNSKLSRNKSIIYKKPMSNTTNLTNITKLSLNHNTTKLSLGDRSLAANKLNCQNQSKTTIRKQKGGKKISNLEIDENIETKINQIERIKASLNIGMKHLGKPHQKAVTKSTTKKKSKSHFTIRC